jgi:hypothetical protein
LGKEGKKKEKRKNIRGKQGGGAEPPRKGLGKEGKKKEERKNIPGKQGGGAEPPGKRGPGNWEKKEKRKKKERIFAGSKAEGRSPSERA